MNHSTEGVTLHSSLIFGVLDQYQHLKTSAQPIFEMASGLDRSQPQALAPMQVYNDICEWIETRYGPASIREAGRAIGNVAYEQLMKDGALGLSPTPNRIIEEMKRVASVMIQDPCRRGWEVLESADNRVRLRRTQTFNCKLQEGLLLTLVERTGAVLPRVNQVHCTRQGADFCEYDVLWLKAVARPFPRATNPRPPAKQQTG